MEICSVSPFSVCEKRNAIYYFPFSGCEEMRKGICSISFLILFFRRRETDLFFLKFSCFEEKRKEPLSPIRGVVLSGVRGGARELMLFLVLQRPWGKIPIEARRQHTRPFSCNQPLQPILLVIVPLCLHTHTHIHTRLFNCDQRFHHMFVPTMLSYIFLRRRRPCRKTPAALLFRCCCSWRFAVAINRIIPSSCLRLPFLLYHPSYTYCYCCSWPSKT